MKHYPSWRYHKELEPKLIKSEQEESPEWKDSPAFFEQKEEVIEQEIKEISVDEIPIHGGDIVEQKRRGRKPKQ